MDDYEEIVKKIPVPERAIGPLAGLAARLDYLGPKVQELENTLSPRVAELTEEVSKLGYTLSKLELPEGVAIMPQEMQQIPFSYNMAALQGVRLSEDAPLSGYIKGVTIHWPDGCNALVKVKVGHGDKQFCPREGFLALNDATPTYPFSEWVNFHENIWVEMENTDGANSHAITVTVTLEGTVP